MPIHPLAAAEANDSSLLHPVRAASKQVVYDMSIIPSHFHSEYLLLYVLCQSYISLYVSTAFYGIFITADSNMLQINGLLSIQCLRFIADAARTDIKQFKVSIFTG